MGHWYTQKGEPMHWVTGKNGKQRDTTLRDAKKLNLSPSVSEVLNVAAKPALTRWIADQTAIRAYNNPVNPGESQEDYLKRLKELDTDVQTTAEIGSQIHSAIESLFRGNPITDHVLAAQAAYQCVIEHTESDIWIPEQTFACKLGYGGMVDLHNMDYVIDFKTKDWTVNDKPPQGYPEHCMQLSAYAHGLGYDNAKLVNVFVSRTQPGLVHWFEWKENMMDRFNCLLAYWQLAKNYKPET